MEWILTFLEFAQSTVVAFTPRIVPAILPNLASSQYVGRSTGIRKADNAADISSSQHTKLTKIYIE